MGAYDVVDPCLKPTCIVEQYETLVLVSHAIDVFVRPNKNAWRYWPIENGYHPIGHRMSRMSNALETSRANSMYRVVFLPMEWTSQWKQKQDTVPHSFD